MVNHGDYNGGGGGGKEEEAVEINDEIISSASYSVEDKGAIQRLPDAANYDDDDDDNDATTDDYDGNNSTANIPISKKQKKKWIVTTVALLSVAFLAMVVGFGADFGNKAKNNNSLSSINEAQGYEMTYAMCMKEQGLPVDGDEVETTDLTTESPTLFPPAGSSASEVLSQAGMGMDMDMGVEVAASGDDEDGKDEEDKDTPSRSNSNDNHMMITIDTTGGRLLRRELRGIVDITAASAKRRELEATCAEFKMSNSSEMSKSNKTASKKGKAGKSAKCSKSGTSTIDFDDFFISVGSVIPIPTNYRGFEWDNMLALRGNLHPNSGYFQGNISPENLAFVFSGSTGAMQSTTPFSVVSLHVTPAWNKDMVLRIQAFRGDTLVGEFVDTLGHPIDDYPSSSFISLEAFSKNNPAQDFADINRLTLVATGGTDAGLVGSGTQLAVDNIVVCSDGMHAVMETYETYEQGEMVEQEYEQGETVEQDFVGSNGRPSLDEEGV